MNFWNYVTIGSAAIMIVLILIQVRGAGLGSGLGGSAATDMNLTRRGSDKSIFNLTIVFAIAFVLSIVLQLILA